MATKPKKIKVVYQETYNRGVIEWDRQKVADLAMNPEVTIEIRETGAYSDDGEFITMTFHISPQYSQQLKKRTL